MLVCFSVLFLLSLSPLSQSQGKVSGAKKKKKKRVGRRGAARRDGVKEELLTDAHGWAFEPHPATLANGPFAW